MPTRFSFLASRLSQTVLVLWVVATLLFLIFRLMPGNPLVAYIDPNFTAEVQQALLRQFGLDQPLHVQYADFLSNLVRGEFGRSIFSREPVSQVMWQVLPNALVLTLPALTLALYLQGLPTLLMRSTMLEVMDEDFITFCRMRGLPERTILLRHAARNALLPVVTAFALGIGYSIGGNVIIETVFSWPGLGRTLVRAVAAKDYPVAQAAFFLIAVVMIVMNFVADLLYSLLDPRVSHERQ